MMYPSVQIKENVHELLCIEYLINWILISVMYFCSIAALIFKLGVLNILYT